MMTFSLITMWLVAAVIVLATVIPFSTVSHGMVRGADFPRQQVLAFAIVLIVVAAVMMPPGWMWVIGLMIPCVLAQGFYIGRYLPVWHKQSLRPRKDEQVADDRSVSFLAANVKKSNRDYTRLIDVSRRVQPDILMALEVDQDWVDALDVLTDIYPHRYAHPLDTGYGMAIYSKIAFEEAAFREKVVDGVPSLRARVPLADGLAFRLYVVHPEPPVPQQDTEGRDAELSSTAIEARDDPLPAIVTGDLNDVAWSITTRRFQEVSGLLDPRVGRGFYNTFSATMPWMRWPLDHLFHDAQFRLLDMRREAHIGSDHFPMYFKLLLTPIEAAEARPDAATKEELDDAKDMIAREKANDREAIGSDWEDEH
ncbi:endonuclease/exonuclease/phosphatase family protein [Loktanella sp. R86503]|uniref:endonuclease/exonuclease/phosphatase family protein n=1 Tax=Loktanella sp. R86503 TaxID=3093847 RepID=UPI0036DD64D5